MTNSNNSPFFAILLPAGCSPNETEELEQGCRDAVAQLDGHVLRVFVENNIDPLVHSLEAGAVTSVIYPTHESSNSDFLLTEMVQGVLGRVYGITLRCADDSELPVIPVVLSQLALDALENCLRHGRGQVPVGQPVPFGYRWNGNRVEIDPDQAEVVHAAFHDAVGVR